MHGGLQACIWVDVWEMPASEGCMYENEKWFLNLGPYVTAVPYGTNERLQCLQYFLCLQSLLMLIEYKRSVQRWSSGQGHNLASKEPGSVFYMSVYFKFNLF